MRQLTRGGGVAARLRRRTGALLVDNFFRGISRAGKFHPHAKPAHHDVVVKRHIPYLDSGLPEHHLDVYIPGPLARREVHSAPVVLYAHGGGFRILSKDTHWLMGLAFARRGYVVFNVGYRLAPRYPFPAAVTDVCAALDYVGKNAQRYGADLDRLVFAGESAGGNLVTSLAIATSYKRPEAWAQSLFDAGHRARAVVAACAILQVSDIERFKRRWPHMSGFIGDRLSEVSDSYLGDPLAHDEKLRDFADPLLLFERGELPDRPLPAFFAPCGTKDPLLDDSRRLLVALTQMGVPCEAKFYPGEVHAFHALVFRPNARRCWADTYAFLDKYVPR